MLWMKAWLETKWRLLYALGVPLAALSLRVPGGIRSAKDARLTMTTMSFFLIFAAVYLAGAGIRTQTFRMMKGVHGSMYFTLSLPVSRLRLLAVRAGFGFAEVVAISVIVVCSAWNMFPSVRAGSTFLDLLQSILAASICTASFYLFSVFLATFLEETWHTFGSLFLIGLAWWGTTQVSLPASANVFAFLGSGSPLITHHLPWPAMAISATAATLLFLAAWRIVEGREY